MVQDLGRHPQYLVQEMGCGQLDFKQRVGILRIAVVHRAGRLPAEGRDPSSALGEN